MTRRISLAPPPNNVPDKNHYSWANWFMTLFERLGSGPFKIQGYPSTDLPDPKEWARTSADDPFTSMIFVVGGNDGPVLAYSNGTNWIKINPGGTVSV